MIRFQFQYWTRKNCDKAGDNNNDMNGVNTTTYGNAKNNSKNCDKSDSNNNDINEKVAMLIHLLILMLRITELC